MKSFIYIFRLVVFGLFRTNGSVARAVENLKKGAIIFSLFFLLFCSSAYGQHVSPVPDGAQVEHLAGDIVFGEGPLWHPDGFLLCCDVFGNLIFKIDPNTGAKEVFLSPSGGASGLAFDTQQNVIMCRKDERGLAYFSSSSPSRENSILHGIYCLKPGGKK